MQVLHIDQLRTAWLAVGNSPDGLACVQVSRMRQHAGSATGRIDGGASRRDRGVGQIALSMLSTMTTGKSTPVSRPGVRRSNVDATTNGVVSVAAILSMTSSTAVSVLLRKHAKYISPDSRRCRQVRLPEWCMQRLYANVNGKAWVPWISTRDNCKLSQCKSLK